MASLTYHLVAEPYLASSDSDQAYVPEAFDEDGFIHCTGGIDSVLATANRYYREDTRSFLALVIDKESVTAEVKYQDPDRIYPHIYSPLIRDAIVSALPRSAQTTASSWRWSS